MKRRIYSSDKKINVSCNYYAYPNAINYGFSTDDMLMDMESLEKELKYQDVDEYDIDIGELDTPCCGFVVYHGTQPTYQDKATQTSQPFSKWIDKVACDYMRRIATQIVEDDLKARNFDPTRLKTIIDENRSMRRENESLINEICKITSSPMRNTDDMLDCKSSDPVIKTETQDLDRTVSAEEFESSISSINKEEFKEDDGYAEDDKDLQDITTADIALMKDDETCDKEEEPKIEHERKKKFREKIVYGSYLASKTKTKQKGKRRKTPTKSAKMNKREKKTKENDNSDDIENKENDDQSNSAPCDEPGTTKEDHNGNHLVASPWLHNNKQTGCLSHPPRLHHLGNTLPGGAQQKHYYQHGNGSGSCSFSPFNPPISCVPENKIITSSYGVANLPRYHSLYTSIYPITHLNRVRYHANQWNTPPCRNSLPGGPQGFCWRPESVFISENCKAQLDLTSQCSSLPQLTKRQTTPSPWLVHRRSTEDIIKWIQGQNLVTPVNVIDTNSMNRNPLQRNSNQQDYVLKTPRDMIIASSVAKNNSSDSPSIKVHSSKPPAANTSFIEMTPPPSPVVPNRLRHFPHPTSHK